MRLGPDDVRPLDPPVRLFCIFFFFASCVGLFRVLIPVWLFCQPERKSGIAMALTGETPTPSVGREDLSILGDSEPVVNDLYQAGDLSAIEFTLSHDRHEPTQTGLARFTLATVDQS